MQDYILRLDISVYNSQRVNLINRITYLFHQKGNFRLWQSLRLLEIMIQLPTSSHLKYDINILIIIKITIHLDDVWMVEMHLNF